MNIFINVLVIGFFIDMIVRDIINIRKIVISTKKSVLEVILYILIISVFCVMTVTLANKVIHYIIGGLAIGYVISQFFKQGIFDGGIMIVQKGKEVYSWDDISKVEIRKGNVIKVSYFGKDGLDIPHKYSLDNYKEIVDMFIKNGIEYEIIYN